MNSILKANAIKTTINHQILMYKRNRASVLKFFTYQVSVPRAMYITYTTVLLIYTPVALGPAALMLQVYISVKPLAAVV